MRAVRVERHEAGPRLFVFGARLHHFHWGVGLIAAGLRFVWVDRRDLADALHKERKS